MLRYFTAVHKIKKGRLPYSVATLPSKTKPIFLLDTSTGYAYVGTNARAIEVCLRLLFNGSRARAYP